MTTSDEAIEVAIEQYCYWKYVGLTLREMVVCTGRQWQPGNTGDEVIIELARAWDGLQRDRAP